MTLTTQFLDGLKHFATRNSKDRVDNYDSEHGTTSAHGAIQVNRLTTAKSNSIDTGTHSQKSQRK